VPGIGPKTEERLSAIGVRTIGDLALVPIEQLAAHFGHSYGLFLHEAAHGIDDHPIVTHWEPKQRSRETTFEHDTSEWQTIARTLAELAREVADELREDGYRGRTIGIKLRFADFQTCTRARTLPDPTDAEITIRKAAFECLSRVQLNRKVRLLGVRVGELTRA
jgi:DNA polymerase-4